MRATQQIVKNRSGTLAKEAAYDDRGQYASWNLPGSFSEGSGCLPGLSWARLGRTWAAFGQLLELLGFSWAPFARFLNTLGRIWALMGASASILEGLWCLWAGCWRAPVAIFAMVFGHAFRVSPLILHNASIAKGNPYWHFLGLSFSRPWSSLEHL